MKHFSIFVLIIFISSCSTQNISYNREKLIKKYSNYKMFLDDKIIQLDTIYLDKDNIEKLKVCIKNKELKITQLRKRDFIGLNVFAMHTAKNNYEEKANKILYFIIDGVLIPKEDIQKIRLDTNGIRSLEILKDESPMFLNKVYEDCVMLIRTK